MPLSITLAIILFFFSDFLAVYIFHDVRLGLIFKILAFIMPFDVFRSILLTSLKGFQLVKYEVYAKNIGENISKIVLTLIILLLGYGIVGAALSFGFAILLSTIIVFYFFQKKIFLVFSGNCLMLPAVSQMFPCYHQTSPAPTGKHQKGLP